MQRIDPFFHVRNRDENTFECAFVLPKKTQLLSSAQSPASNLRLHLLIQYLVNHDLRRIVHAIRRMALAPIVADCVSEHRAVTIE